MNSRRAANRARSLNRAPAPMRDDPLNHRTAERHEDMKGRRMPGVELSNQEAAGANYRHEPHYSSASPASMGASKGPGPLPGAGELPAHGPGAAARRYAQRDASETPMAEAPTGAAPKGMSTYNQE